jgi:excisionase family DNA binding protein
MPYNHPATDALLTPREVAAIFGVHTTTIARWARDAKLTPLRAPGGHRRYSRQEVRRLLTEETPDEATRQLTEDAARPWRCRWGCPSRSPSPPS